jgi:exonuclease VII large subunit
VQQSVQTLSTALQTLFIPLEEVIERFGQTKEKLKMMCETYKQTVRQSGILLANVDPKRLLRRGYSVVRNENGEVISSITKLVSGARVSIQVYDGKRDGIIK